MNMNLETRRVDTKKRLELAIKRIQEKMPKVVPVGHKLSIAAVAREAGVSNATIHNRYPGIAEKIRGLISGNHMQQLNIKKGHLKDYQKKLTKINKENKQLRIDLAKSQSINLRLLKENEWLRTQITK